jgi:hypothetical protein
MKYTFDKPVVSMEVKDEFITLYDASGNLVRRMENVDVVADFEVFPMTVFDFAEVIGAVFDDGQETLDIVKGLMQHGS